MTVDSGGHFLFAANTSDGTVSVFTIDANGALAQISGSPFPSLTSSTTAAGPRALTLDPTGAFLYVANGTSNNVSAFSVNATTGSLTALSGSPFAAGTGPLFILSQPGDDNNFVLVGNQGSTNITSLSIDNDTAPGKLTAASGSPFSLASAPGAMVVVR